MPKISTPPPSKLLPPPSQWCNPLTQDSTQESNPQTPFQKGVGDSNSDQDIEKRLEAFKAVYPCVTTRQAELTRLINALSDEEAELLAKAAAGYAVHCRKFNRKPLDPVRFARDPDLWPDFAKMAPPPAPEKQFVERGSQAWRGLCVIRAVLFGPREYLPPLAPAGLPNTGAMIGTLVDCAVDLEALESLAQFASDAGRPEFDAWQGCIEDTRQWHAWRERASRLGFGQLKADLYQVPGEFDTSTMPDGSPITAPRRVQGNLVPSEWPPRLGKDPDGQVEETEAVIEGELVH